MKSGRLVLLGALAALCLSAFAQINQSPTGGRERLPWGLPPDFPVPRIPMDNPPTQAKFELGRHLFYDRRLSGNGKLACAGCHRQELAFSDGRPLSPGSTGENTTRNAQHLGNSAWHTTYTWANPVLTTLERQMGVPLFGEHPVEMGVNDQNRDRIIERLRKQPIYRHLFQAAYPGPAPAFSWQNVIASIATFQRGLVTGNSRFDRYQRGQETLSESEMRGKDLFFGEKAECFHCHGGFNFSDQIAHAGSRHVAASFHNTGLYNLDERGSYPEPSRGVYDITGQDEDMGRFRAPSLRNVEVTAPYMHDGSVRTLEEVLSIYAAGGRNIESGKSRGDGRKNPQKSELIGTIKLTTDEQRDIINFLKTLTDQDFLRNLAFADPWGTSPGRRKSSK